MLVVGHLVGAVQTTAAQEGQREVRVADIDGARLRYKIVGTGPPLLLLHGFSGSASWWDSMIPELAGSYTLIIPDLPGHGASSGGKVPYVYRDVAGQIFRLLDHAGIERTHAVGYSAGGILLLHMALQEPERISAMALVSAIHRANDSIRNSLRNWPSFAETPAALKEYWLQIHPGGEPQVRSLISALRRLAETSNNMALLPEGECPRLR
jgi:pimeloyl-ACP methyl ester carboxylesterase